jgi:hypothetical protein
VGLVWTENEKAAFCAALGSQLDERISVVAKTPDECDVLAVLPFAGCSWAFALPASGDRGDQIVIGWLDRTVHDPLEAYDCIEGIDIIAAPKESDFEYLRHSRAIFLSELSTLSRTRTPDDARLAPLGEACTSDYRL